MIRRFTLVLVVLTLLTVAAWADGKAGMYWTSGTDSDGVHVRRLEDTTHRVVCYIATNQHTGSESPAISCVKVPQ
jgi:hypothetical protein